MKIQIDQQAIYDALKQYYEREGLIIDTDTLRLTLEMIDRNVGVLVGSVEAKVLNGQQTR